MDQTLIDMKAALNLIEEITWKDVDTEKIWLSCLYQANGHLNQAISEFERNKERRYKEIGRKEKDI